MSLDKVTVLLADELHFHERNFKSLFDFFNKYKVKYEYAKTDKSWLSLYGNYSSKKKFLKIYFDLLVKLNAEELLCFEVCGHNVFELVRSELLSFLIPQDNWVDESIKYDENLFYKIFERNREELLLNMAAACYWSEFWNDYLDNSRTFTYCCIFSGCLIYTKVLMICLKNRVTDPLLFEMSFTGKDYYCENQYGVIPNNSIIKYSNFYNNISIDLKDYLHEVKIKNKAINKYILMNNKNVTQPDFSEKIVFENEAPSLLIIGQVVNDFSILESDLDEYNSLLIYKDILLKTLKETNFNIIFKAHPWECKKNNLYRSLTKDILLSFISELDDDFQKRIVVVENYNLIQLFNLSSFVLTLCSQAAIEAAYNGMKCIQLANSFYGNKGFTHDCNLNNFIDVLLRGEKNLSISEFEAFNVFLIKYLVEHLISIHNSGHINLNKIFSKVDRIQLLQPNTTLEKKESVSPVQLVVEKKADMPRINVNTKVCVDNTRVLGFKINKELNDKISKFMNNPENFFKDSKYLSLRKVGHLYKAFKQN